MSKKPETFEELLRLWDRPKALSDALGVTYINAQQILRRKSIGIAHWPKVIELAAERGIRLTNDDLVAMSLKRKAVAA